VSYCKGTKRSREATAAFLTEHYLNHNNAVCDTGAGMLTKKTKTIDENK
jgi:hypothetical protein